jgi:hypothetical protein
MVVANPQRVLKYYGENMHIRKLDCFAAEMIPIRMIISIAIIAAIGVMVAIGYHNLNITNSENLIHNQCSELQSELYTLTASGVARDVDEINAGEGTKRVYSFDLPDSINYLAFGVDPDSDNNGVLSTGLTSDGSMICYKVDGGSKKIIWLSEDDVRFREGKFTGDKWVINTDNTGDQGFVISDSGTSTLTFELVKQHDQLFILIQATDSLNTN